MNISSAIFKCSAPDLESCPDESLPEFAFIGRSNVGKSSLLNMLAGKDGLAHVSPTPGFTKLINIFTMNKTWRLVDLPGYGFAHVAREDSARFNQAVNDYLQQRKNLVCVFALIDSGLSPQKIDLEFVEWLTSHSIPYALVFTKTDRSKPEQVQANIAAFSDCISKWFQQLPEILTCSATTGQGRGELLAVIEKSIPAAPDEPAESPQELPPDATSVPEETPAPGWTVRAGTTKAERNPVKHRKIARPW
ncbi:MAG TPA: ribosome biogenesis GTP-binding protein YihA/YsxC [Candidatus Acidoferrum sp.]|nr:ribosome biogenesis GTP-binding protein YihA/YsxC [Candidatus Acidoferrum sp.]